jgi:hypothetical protein
VGSVLEYGSVCYTGMARTHMLRLERVQYRGIRIALGLIFSKNSLGILSGIAPLAERFVYLNFRCFVAVFYRLDHPLEKRLETLRELNLGRCIAGYCDVLPLNIVSSASFTRHDLPALLASHFGGTFRGSDIYVFGGGSPRAVDSDMLHRWFFIRMALW